MKLDAIKVVAASSQNGVYTRAKEPVSDAAGDAGANKGGDKGKKQGNTQSKAAKKALAKAEKEVIFFFFLAVPHTVISLKAAEFGDEPAAEAAAE